MNPSISPQICPQVVCLSRYKGKLIQNCHVYIGLTYKTDEWDLLKTLWHNPYPLQPDKSNLLQTLKDYDAHVRSHLLPDIPKLTGKVLGCFCRKPNNGKDLTPNTSPNLICHGDVLVNIWKELNRDYVVDEGLWKSCCQPIEEARQLSEFLDELSFKDTREPLVQLVKSKSKKRKKATSFEEKKDSEKDNEKGDNQWKKKKIKSIKTQETHPEGLKDKGKMWPWPNPNHPDNAFTIWVDEAGMGCLMGDLVIVATYLLPNFNVQGIHDSKLIKDQLEEIFPQVTSNPDVIYHIEHVTNDEVDEYKLGQAWKRGTSRAIQGLLSKLMEKNLQHLITRAVIDGSDKSIPGCEVKIEYVTKGDRHYCGIATASVIAKVTRDHWIIEQSKNYGEEWKDIMCKQKGYTGPGFPGKRDKSKHERLLMAGNYTDLHRKSYGRLKEFLQLQFTSAIRANRKGKEENEEKEETTKKEENEETPKKEEKEEKN